MRKFIPIIGILLFSVLKTEAQSIDIPSLFNPGIRVGGLYLPEISVNDSVKYGMGRIRTTFIIPLNGNIKVSLKDLNIAARQSFLSVNAGVRETDFSPMKTSNNLYNLSVSFLHIRASISNGLWVYYGRAGLDNDLRNDQNIFFTGLAGAAKIYIKGINKINVFGLGVVYSKRVWPVPIIGLRRKLAENTTLTAILPIEVDITHKFSNKFEAEFKNAVAALKTGFVVDTLNTHYRNDHLILSNFNLQTSLLFIYKATRNLQIYAEGGVYPFLRLNLTLSDEKTKIVTYNYYFAPYAGITIRYNIGKFLFGSQLFGTDE